MSMHTMRQQLREAGIAGAETLSMSYDASQNQIFTLTGPNGAQRHILRPAHETSDISIKAIIAELKGKS